MDDQSQTKIVSAFRDAAKMDLVAEIPIIDSGAPASAAEGSMSDDMLIHTAKRMLRGNGTENVDTLHYEVRRVR